MAAKNSSTNQLQVSAKTTTTSEAVEVARFKFAHAFQADALEIGHGEYTRKFLRGEEPFAARDEDEARLLRGMSEFSEVTTAEAATVTTDEHHEVSDQQ
jgi:flagellar basal body rod protein FlgG